MGIWLIILALALLAGCAWIGGAVVRRNPAEAIHLPVMSAIYGECLLFLSAFGAWLVGTQIASMITLLCGLALSGIIITAGSLIYLRMRRYSTVLALGFGWGMSLMAYSLLASLPFSQMPLILAISAGIIGLTVMVISLYSILKQVARELAH